MKIRSIRRHSPEPGNQRTCEAVFVIAIWCARLVWALLPIAAGDAISDALDAWSTGPARMAAVLLWAGWAAGELALLAPRPWGLTLLRVVAPGAVLITVAAAPSTSAVSATLAIATAVVAAGFALSANVAQATGNSLAYGDEARFPLRIPTPLLLALVPLAVLVVLAGASSGPLLLAEDRIAAGVVALLIGIPAAVVAARSLHSLSKRWLVLVPAGVVVVDPLTLADPLLVRREQVATLARADSRHIPEGTLDLTLGTTFAPVLLETRAPVVLTRRHGRKDAQMAATALVLVAPVLQRQLLTAATAHRIPTG
jgi:hypothetical protein